MVRIVLVVASWCLFLGPLLMAQDTPQEKPQPAKEAPSDEKKSSETEKTDKKDGKDAEEPAEELTPEEKKERRRARIRRNSTSGFGSFSNLISIPQIQSELKLSDPQRLELNNQLKRSRVRVRQMYSHVRDLPREQQSARMYELREQADAIFTETEQSVRKLLTPEQLARVNGISLQMRGPMAMLDPAVIEMLELTDEQVEQIYQIVEKHEATISKLMRERQQQKATGPTKNAVARPQQGMRDLRENLEKDIMAILTDEQREKLSKLQGDEYRFQPRSTEKPTPVEPDSDKKKKKPADKESSAEPMTS